MTANTITAATTTAVAAPAADGRKIHQRAVSVYPRVV